MTKLELLKLLEEAAMNPDVELAHADADNALLTFIDDVEITEAFNAIEKWYA